MPDAAFSSSVDATCPSALAPLILKIVSPTRAALRSQRIGCDLGYNWWARVAVECEAESTARLRLVDPHDDILQCC